MSDFDYAFVHCTYWLEGILVKLPDVWFSIIWGFIVTPPAFLFSKLIDSVNNTGKSHESQKLHV